MQLEDIIKQYGVPDPSIVGKLPRGGITLDFVGHAEITRILIDIDPNWFWEPCGWVNGRPAINETNGMAVMWGNLTILGKSMLGVGSVRADKPDLDKELVGDFLRNASMRFGICLSLWSKSEWEEPAQTAKPVGVVSQENIDRFKAACKQANLDPETVAKEAGVSLVGLKDDDMGRLRDVFKKMKEPPAPTNTPLTAAEAEKAIVETFAATPVEPVHSPNVKPSNPGSKVGGTQLAKLKALMNSKGFVTAEQKLELAVGSVKHPLHDLNEMTKGEVWELIEILAPQ
ncbi:MAG: hypothetical protein FJ267_10545 [Planctomycetes bacterium]|nr:hypothetical protein [Planctomycetota bacterium]